jgi:hypothetical protein
MTLEGAELKTPKYRLDPPTARALAQQIGHVRRMILGSALPLSAEDQRALNRDEASAHCCLRNEWRAEDGTVLLAQERGDVLLLCSSVPPTALAAFKLALWAAAEAAQRARDTALAAAAAKAETN